MQGKGEFSELTENDEAVFESWKPLIDKKLRDTISSIPIGFELKPTSVRCTHACDVFYDFKVALPDGAFAKVSFNGNAGYIMGRKTRDPTAEDVEISTE